MATKDSSDWKQQTKDDEVSDLSSESSEINDSTSSEPEPQTNYRLKFEEMQQTALRAQADLENQQKRFDKEKTELFDMAKKSILFSLIPALDSFHLANSHLPDDLKNNSWALGMQAVGSQLKTILGELGVSSYSCIGQKFDANRAEAIEEIEDESDKPSGTVILELSPGWEIAGLVVRPAKVKVKK
jgi:molecular chaperone GrpE